MILLTEFDPKLPSLHIFHTDKMAVSANSSTHPFMTETSKRLVLRRPDDWHVHLRDDAMLDQVARYTSAQFARF